MSSITAFLVVASFTTGSNAAEEPERVGSAGIRLPATSAEDLKLIAASECAETSTDAMSVTFEVEAKRLEQFIFNQQRYRMRFSRAVAHLKNDEVKKGTVLGSLYRDANDTEILDAIQKDIDSAKGKIQERTAQIPELKAKVAAARKGEIEYYGLGRKAEMQMGGPVQLAEEALETAEKDIILQRKAINDLRLEMAECKRAAKPLELAASFTGRVAYKAESGAIVGYGQDLAHLTSFRALEITGKIPKSQARKLEAQIAYDHQYVRCDASLPHMKNLAVRFSVRRAGLFESGEGIEGYLTSDPGILKPGKFTIVASFKKPALLEVPASAIVETNTGKFVLRQDKEDPEVYHIRPVEIQAMDKSTAYVRPRLSVTDAAHGLAPLGSGDMIVTKDAASIVLKFKAFRAPNSAEK